MLDLIINFVKTHDSKSHVRKFFGRDWFGGNFRGRLPVLIFRLAFQALYFPINQFLSQRGGEVEVGSSDTIPLKYHLSPPEIPLSVDFNTSFVGYLENTD